MSNGLRGVLGLGLGSCVVALALAGCRVDGQTRANEQVDGPPDEGPVARCAAGDRDAGRSLIESHRSARLDADPQAASSPGSSLAGACEGGCAVACLELARASFVLADIRGWQRRACELGDAIGCALGSELELASAIELCDAGEMQGCAAALRLAGEGSVGVGEGLVAGVVEASAQACASGEGRACSVHAWTRCALLGQCDAAAIEALRRAATLLPEPEVLETLALVQCRSGAAEQANSTLAAACEAGVRSSCERGCVALLGASVLVGAAERQRYDRVALLLLLQLDARPGWYATLSAMGSDEFAEFEALLEAFTPPISEAAAGVSVPAELRERYPALVESIVRSPQLDKKQVRYWLGRLPKLTDEQRDNLVDSLRKQWWVIAGEPGRSPQAFIDRVTLQHGGLGPS